MVVNDDAAAARSGTGRWTKLGFAIQVVVALVLALLVCGLLVHVAEWRKLRWRTDLTASGRNTLDPQTEGLLLGLKEPARVDIFFRPASFEHLARVTNEAQRRMSELLFVARNLAPDLLDVERHDLYDLAATQGRMDELGIDEVQTVVVSLGERRAVLRLFTEIARIDVGNPDPRASQPATLQSFRGEEAFAEALKKVSASDTPRVYFSTGHGEMDPFGTENRELGRLSTELERQGFEIATWEGEEAGPVPEDCDVLAIVGPVQPFSEREQDYVDGYVDAGGRLFAATSARFDEEPGSVAGMLRRYGMLLARGIVCVPVLDYFGNLREETPKCADFLVSESELSPQHPITAPLVERGRRVRFSFARSFERGGAPEGGLLLDLASSPSEAWRDLPDADDKLDFALDNTRESAGRFRVAMAASFPGASSEEAGNRGDARVVAVASPFFMANTTFPTNRDFLSNAFNWLAERDFRVGVAARDPEASTLDVSRGKAMTVVFHTSLWGLPGVFGLLGVMVFLRRRPRAVLRTT